MLLLPMEGDRTLFRLLRKCPEKISNGYFELDDINESTISEYMYPA
ncbi:hypothetical protein [Methanohalobium sp.]|nr:hypothetical protein [Methanohalobium sp.]